RGQHRPCSAVPLRQHLFDHGLRLADALPGRLQRSVFSEVYVDVGDVEILTRKKLVVKRACEVASESEHDRQCCQNLPALVDRKTSDAAVPPAEASLPHPLGSRFGLRLQEIERQKGNESHRDEARRDQRTGDRYRKAIDVTADVAREQKK